MNKKMIHVYLEDNEYEKTTINHTRLIARAFVLDENDKFVMLKIKRDDEFGNSTYIETSGGGIEENEDIIEGLKRELDEELGVKVEIISKIGIIDDYYNKINRHNINHYYLVKIIGYTKIHHESKGDDLIFDILHLSINDILNEYKNKDAKIKKLVYNREEIIFNEIIKKWRV